MPLIVSLVCASYKQGRIQDFGKGGGGGGGLINIFTTGGGYGRGRAPSRDSKGVWGSADSSPSGLGRSPSRFFAFAFI